MMFVVKLLVRHNWNLCNDGIFKDKNHFILIYVTWKRSITNRNYPILNVMKTKADTIDRCVMKATDFKARFCQRTDPVLIHVDADFAANKTSQIYSLKCKNGGESNVFLRLFLPFKVPTTSSSEAETGKKTFPSEWEPTWTVSALRGLKLHLYNLWSS